MKLIPDLAAAHRLWSVRIAAIGALLTAVLAAASPEAILIAWDAVPAEVRALLPEHVDRWLAPVLLAATAIARVVKQRGASK